MPAQRPKSAPLRRRPTPSEKPESSIISTMQQVQARSTGAMWMTRGSWLHMRKRRISDAAAKTAGASRSQKVPFPRRTSIAVIIIRRAESIPPKAARRSGFSMTVCPSSRTNRDPKKTRIAATRRTASQTGLSGKQASVPGRRLSRMESSHRNRNAQTEATTVTVNAWLPRGSSPASSKDVLMINTRSAVSAAAQPTAAQRSALAALECSISIPLAENCFSVL